MFNFLGSIHSFGSKQAVFTAATHSHTGPLSSNLHIYPTPTIIPVLGMESKCPVLELANRLGVSLAHYDIGSHSSLVSLDTRFYPKPALLPMSSCQLVQVVCYPLTGSLPALIPSWGVILLLSRSSYHFWSLLSLKPWLPHTAFPSE